MITAVHLSLLEWIALFALIIGANASALVFVHVAERVMDAWRKRERR